MNIEGYYTIIVGVLSILVTVLIGYQLFGTIDFERRLNHFKLEIKEQYKIDVEKAKYDATGMSLAQLGLSQYYTDDYSNAIRSLFNAIRVLEKGSNDEFANEANIHAIDLIYMIVSDKRVTGAFFSAEEKRANIASASNIKDIKKRDKILAFLYLAKTQEQ